MSLVSELMHVHADALMHLNGDLVTYARASGASCRLGAVHGATDHDSRTPEGAIVTVRLEDWLVEVAEFELVFGKGAVPEDDDVIVFCGRRYLVKPIDDEPCFRVQPGGVLFRIHTKGDGAE